MAVRVSALFQLVKGTTYCPSENEFQIGGGATWTGNGWDIQGGGGVQGMTSFNMLGGYLEFDLDNSGSKWGVNNNFYTISPDHPYTSYNDYCDGQGPEASSPTGTYCMELDIWEGNGNEEGATTWHTWFNRNGGCDMGGCGAHYSGGGQMNFRVDFDFNGNWHVRINGVENSGFSPNPSPEAMGSVRDTMERVGVTFVSSQWTGWVPGAGTVTGDLDNSFFSVSNLRVNGQVLMGPTPPECSGPSPSPGPSPGPSPSPGCDCSWTAGGSQCGAGDGSFCWGQCCCDCSWTSGGSVCGQDDGSSCWSACCAADSKLANPTNVTVMV